MIEINLLNTSNGPLSLIMEFLDVIDLARFESVCKLIRCEVAYSWTPLIEKVRPFALTEPEKELTCKERVGRWSRVSKFAQHVEQLNVSRFRDKENILKCQSRSHGITTYLSDIQENRIENILEFREYFVRFSYHTKSSVSPKVVFEDFLEPYNLGGSFRNHAIIINLEKNGPPKAWRELHDCKNHFSRHGYFAFTQKTNKLLNRFSQDLVLTIVGIDDCKHVSCWLVYLSSGEQNVHEETQIPKRIAFRGRWIKVAPSSNNVVHQKLVVGSSVAFFQDSLHLIVARGDHSK